MYAGVIIWFVEHDEVVYVPIQTVLEMVEAGKKSINIKEIDYYHIVRLPSVKKRTFLETDYTEFWLR